jgi:hypothetical protein
MSVPKFLTLEELIRDHERLCAEVEELKKQFEGHVHYTNSKSVRNPEFPDLRVWATSEPQAYGVDKLYKYGTLDPPKPPREPFKNNGQ